MTLVQINQSVAKIISSINEIQVSQSLLILITIIVGVYTDGRRTNKPHTLYFDRNNLVYGRTIRNYFGTQANNTVSVCQWQTFLSQDIQVYKRKKASEVLLAQEEETCSNNDLLWFPGQMFLGESLFTNPLHHFLYNTRDVEANQWNVARKQSCSSEVQ